jgi:hypothetical protein
MKEHQNQLPPIACKSFALVGAGDWYPPSLDTGSKLQNRYGLDRRDGRRSIMRSITPG